MILYIKPAIILFFQLQYFYSFACHNLAKVEESPYYNLRLVLKMLSLVASAICDVFYLTQSTEVLYERDKNLSGSPFAVHFV